MSFFDLPPAAIDTAALDGFLAEQLPESVNLDYKKELSASVYETIAAMANTYDGIVLVGVDEDGNDLPRPVLPPVGVRSGDRERLVNQAYTCLQPPFVLDVVPITLPGGVDVLVVRVDSSRVDRPIHFFRHFLQEANPPYTSEEIERYVEAWSQEGAAAGMINYYRASVRQSQKEAEAKLRPISALTLVIWGERDSYLGSDLAEPHADDVPNLDRVERLADASHWVHHDEAERVNQLLIDFFAPAA
jgi:pimeloyl-ACP methyl ester carboxylesterase